MPNYCGNRWTITGDRVEREKLIKQLHTKGTELDLSVMRPEPEYKNPKTDWYGRRCKNWGTKWNVGEAFIDTDDKETTFSFCTAWSPCKPKMIRNFMKKNHPNLSWIYRFAEKGANVYGKFDSTGRGFCKTIDDDFDFREFRAVYDMSH